jgi:hypothetical protein
VTETTPAAAPAAPAAVVPDPATPVATAAPADSTAPAAPAAKPTSLVPESLEPQSPAPPAAAPVEPQADDKTAWFLYDGVKGQGDMPAWYKADKYKTVAAQAEAYTHLERRLGAFVGAPKEGKYEAPKLPEGIEGEFLTDHPVFESFTKWALENQVSQQGYNDVLGMLAVYEASQAPDFEAAKKEIGNDADVRIQNVSLWARANLDAEGYKEYMAALGGVNAASVFKTIEKITEKARQPARAKPGEVVGDEAVSPLADIAAMQAKVNPATGRRFYEEDAAYRDRVEKKRMAYFAAQSQQ